MAVDEEASLWPTENLLLQEGRKHYRTNVSPIHWQLRSLISAERQDRQDIVYFPAGIHNTHITRLNTATRECDTIKVIGFHPRCLVASDGWICCGGESGEFVVIQDVTRTMGRTNAPEDALNNDFQPTLNSLESSNLPVAEPLSRLQRDMLDIVDRLNGSNRTWTTDSYKVGRERVNCITIWQPSRDHPHPAQYTSAVAVLANNDKSISIFNLQDGEVVDSLDYPDCVNRGVISPDGTLLVAICDDPFLYVHQRVSRSRGSREFTDWVQQPKIRLKGQWNQDNTDCRGSFAACFSASGRYLAVGTQYGSISIFDANALKEPDSEALITYFNSSRSPGEEGAVRDMCFSPGPYDLLAWTEHRGRIGVADARSNFMRRQIISIDNHEGFDHVSLNDRSTIDPRLLDPRSERNTAVSPSMPSLVSASSSGRPLPNPESSDPTSRINQPFTQEETAILEAVQSDRRRREAREQISPREQREQREQQQRESRDQQQYIARGSPAWRSHIWAERVSPQPRPHPFLNQGAVERAQERAQQRDNSSRYLSRFNLMDFQRETLTRILERERIRETRDQQRSAASQLSSDQDRERRAPTPRRRSSIMQALTQNVDNISQIMNRSQGPSNNNHNNNGNNSNNNESSGSGTRVDPLVPLLTGRATSGWSDLEALVMSGGDGGLHDTPRNESSRARRAIPVISDVWNDDISGFRRAYGRSGSREHQQNPDDTAGLTWSDDGRTLYIGAEDGIYEIRINLQDRKVFPTVTLR
ncbi:hypothetical protein F5B20DRAFT_571010 [Whalleya microplaca]|nr:hypothetical protein F5B20DRAFT_571010 [Whalleya microplaca]